MDKSIIVLMSTYNGEKYIKEQIDSILAQKGVKLTLLIRDDGSRDNTVCIIREYEKTNDNIYFINQPEEGNIGFNNSFYTLIDKGLKFDQTTALFAFADQDDVWLPDKLSSAIKLIDDRIKNSGKSLEDNPLYYYSNKKWTDEKLVVQHEDSFVYCKEDYFDMFMLPPVYGCTTVFNRILGEKTLEKMPPNDLLYDVYMYRMACTMDSILIADKKAYILYRRHGDNVSGDAMKFSPLNHFKNYLSGNNSFHGIQNYLNTIYDLHSGEMMEEQKELCEIVRCYDRSLSKRIRLLFWKKAYERGIKASIMWVGRVVLKAI